MTIFKRLFDFYIQSSIHVGLAVFSLVYCTAFENDLCKHITYPSCVLFGTIVGYNFLKYFDVYRKRKFKSLKYYGIILVCLFSLYGFYFFFRIMIDVIKVQLLLGGILVLVYPLLPQGKRAKGVLIAGSNDAEKLFEEVRQDPRFSFVQADVLKIPFADQTFDVVWSEGVLHHTPSTYHALESCVRVLKSDGVILFYVYRKKAPLREFADDYIRNAIAELPPDQAWAALEPLTHLAKAFSDIKARVEIPIDVDLLGFKAGAYDVQRFLYYNVMKFYWNDEFTFDENVHINYDWYYPKYCWRHTVQEIREWLRDFNLEELEMHEADSGIGVVARKRAA